MAESKKKTPAKKPANVKPKTVKKPAAPVKSNRIAEGEHAVAPVTKVVPKRSWLDRLLGR